MDDWLEEEEEEGRVRDHDVILSLGFCLDLQCFLF